MDTTPEMSDPILAAVLDPLFRYLNTPFICSVYVVSAGRIVVSHRLETTCKVAVLVYYMTLFNWNH
jgi:hypothetical protein